MDRGKIRKEKTGEKVKNIYFFKKAVSVWGKD